MKSTRLIVSNIDSLESQDLLINRALTVAQIYHLEIQNEEITNGTLLRIVDFLPELLSLNIFLLLFEELTEEEVDILLSREDTSQITKVCLEMMTEITDIYFLMAICPKMEYLRIDSLNDMDIKVCLRKILKKIKLENNQYLRLLCFSIEEEEENDKLIQQLEYMINKEKLIIDYSIRCVYGSIFLQWK